jgi:hypothetical protein
LKQDSTTDKPGPSSSAGSLASGADRIRESAKWLIVAFAGVGAVLAAGLGLSGLGGLDNLHLTWSILGLAIAVGGVVLAVMAAGEVVTASFVTMKWLSQQAGSDPAMVGVEGDTGLLGGYASVEELKLAYDMAIKDRRDALKATYEDPDDPAKRLKAEAGQAWVKTLDLSQDHVIERASFNKLRAAYKTAGHKIAAGAVLAAIGIAIFAWGANPPDAVSAAVVMSVPTDVVVAIDKEDRPVLQSSLGASCDLSDLHGVAVGVVGETVQVATVATKDCKVALIEVTHDMGRVSATSDAATTVVQPTDTGGGHTP